MKKWLPGLTALLMTFQVAASEHRADPQSISQTFYNWYLAALVKDESPIDEHDPRLNQYVTQRLLQKINLLIKSPDGMDDDYFLQDQDYNDSWVNHISVSRFTQAGNRATGEVVLGNDPRDSQHLLVTLLREADGWKIDEIEPESPPDDAP